MIVLSLPFYRKHSLLLMDLSERASHPTAGEVLEFSFTPFLSFALDPSSDVIASKLDADLVSLLVVVPDFGTRAFKVRLIWDDARASRTYEIVQHDRRLVASQVPAKTNSLRECRSHLGLEHTYTWYDTASVSISKYL